MRELIRLIAILCILPASLVAEPPFPARYDVVGVAADDVLNARRGPGTAYPVTDTLAPDATGIEVLAIDDGWARIGRGEATLFASAHFLERQPGQDGVPMLSNLPVTCVGTEPFWSVRFEDEGYLTFDPLGGEVVDIDLNNFATSANDLRSSSFEGSGDAGPVLGVLRRTQCFDGMSDREFGIAIEFFPQVTGGLQHLTGCCRLD